MTRILLSKEARFNKYAAREADSWNYFTNSHIKWHIIELKLWFNKKNGGVEGYKETTPLKTTIR